MKKIITLFLLILISTPAYSALCIFQIIENYSYQFYYSTAVYDTPEGACDDVVNEYLKRDSRVRDGYVRHYVRKPQCFIDYNRLGIDGKLYDDQVFFYFDVWGTCPPPPPPVTPIEKMHGDPDDCLSGVGGN